MNDVFVLSDLHLGRGKNPHSGRYFSLEAFFYDDDLRRFLRYLVTDAARRGAPFKLVFNGDVFDLLRIEPEEAPPGASHTERRYGPALTPATAARITEQILTGHSGFVDAVSEVLEAGYEVLFLPGNHDVELQWEPVHAVVRRALVERVRARALAAAHLVGDTAGETARAVEKAGLAATGGMHKTPLAVETLAQSAADAAAHAADQRLFFQSWFYYEPGRLWIEHGCQYDAESSFRYPLRGALARAADAAEEAETDLPLGSFIQRYLYNAFGAITFVVPSTRANFRYFKWLLVNRPRLLARVVASHGPFAIQLLRRLGRSSSVPRDGLRRVHVQELEDLSRDSGLGERLAAIDGLKQVSHNVFQAAKAVSWQLLKFVGLVAMVASAVAGLWFAGFHTISQMRVGFGPKALLFLALNFLLLFSALGGVGYGLFRSPPAISAGPLQRAARHIAGVLDVPIVTFGHTHDEALWRIDRPTGKPAWYYNTGTWIAVFTHDELMPRERVQFTFLRVRGMEAELLQWSPGRGEPMPVILLDEEGRDGAPIHPGGALTG